jgi:hypothetical protein
MNRLIIRIGFLVASFIRRLNARSFLAVAGMAGPLVLIIAEVVAASSAEHYDIVSDSISSLALTPMGYVQTIGFLAIGLLVEVFTAGLLFGVRAARGFHLSIVCLVFMGFGMLLIGAFRTDPVGAPDTIEGIIHSIAAGIVFWLFPVASLLMAPSFRRDLHWQDFFRYTLVTSGLALALVIITTVLEDSASWFGLAERICVANMIIWVEIIAVRLFMLSLRPKNR